MSETGSLTYHEKFGLEPKPVPVDSLIAPNVFERERERVFRRVWQNVGRADDIPEAGDYFVKDIAVLRTSVLVVRGEHGEIRAFHNMCRHRGNKVARSCEGQAKGFRCNFHGWAYDLEGKLVTVPDEDQFFGFRRADHGLVPLSVDTWEGFIFIHPDPDPPETLESFLGEMVGHFAGYPFGEFRRAVTYVADVRANWKVFMDAFQEAYHVPFVHASSIPDALRGMDLSPFLHLPTVRLYERHRSTSLTGNPIYEPRPSEKVIERVNPLIVAAPGVPPEAVPPGANHAGVTPWSFDINFFFPNFAIFVSGPWYLTYNFWPVSPTRTVWEVKQYMKPPRTVAERVCQESLKIALRDPIREDLSRLEDVQQMLESRACSTLPLSDQEVLIRHSYDVLERYMEPDEVRA